LAKMEALYTHGSKVDVRSLVVTLPTDFLN
jgi:hypothetical protein